MPRRWIVGAGVLCLVAAGAYLLRAPGEAGGSAVDAPADSAGTAIEVLSDSVLDALTKPRFGDFDSMMARRIVRILVIPSRTFYFVDQGTPRGLAVDAAALFEQWLNRKYRTGALSIRVLLLPVRHDELLPALLAGRGDLVFAGLTITPEREAVAAFSSPTLTNVSEIVVTGPASPRLDSIEDLSGKEVFVRKSSAYYESLQSLNASFARRGLAPVRLRAAPEALEDEDLLEMLNAGLVKLVVLNDFLASFWQQVLPNITPQPGLVVKSGADLAWMFRKGSPQLRTEVDEFLAAYPAGSATRNTLLHRYLRSTRYVSAATSAEETRKFDALVTLFRKYSATYDLDYLLMMAQGYQESRLDQGARSRVGAIGVMQVMPATGASLGVGNIHELEPNIHAGVKYVRQIIDTHFDGDSVDALNRTLFAFASYNAGPARVAGFRRRAAARGLDPNRWHGNVEHIAAQEVGRETVTYVSNIFKYYAAYALIMEQEAERQADLKEK